MDSRVVSTETKCKLLRKTLRICESITTKNQGAHSWDDIYKLINILGVQISVGKNSFL